MTPANRTLIVRSDEVVLRIAKGASEAWNLSLDWSRQIPTGEISSSAWVDNSGTVTLGTGSVSGLRTTVPLSGGSAGCYARLTNTIITAAGETLTADVLVEVDRD